MGWNIEGNGSWSVTIPGQPPSGNHANKIGKGYRKGGISFPKMVKTPEAEAYQATAGLITKTARPSGWRWTGGFIVAEYRLYLHQDADCTNIWKTVEDAVFPALGINDSWCLPRALSKTIVAKGDARVEITLYEQEGT
jgi:hypothetical protein